MHICGIFIVSEDENRDAARQFAKCSENDVFDKLVEGFPGSADYVENISPDSATKSAKNLAKQLSELGIVCGSTRSKGSLARLGFSEDSPAAYYRAVVNNVQQTMAAAAEDDIATGWARWTLSRAADMFDNYYFFIIDANGVSEVMKGSYFLDYVTYPVYVAGVYGYHI